MRKLQTLPTLALCALLLLTTTACGMVRSLIGGGSAAAPAALWSDVPEMPGMTKSSTELPLVMRLMIDGLVQSATAGQGEGTNQIDKPEALMFETTKTTAEVSQFYTNERMAATGWKPQEGTGCMATAELPIEVSADQLPGGGTLCAFVRTDAADAQKANVLFMLSSGSKDSSNTLVYFLRVGYKDATTKQP
jgi:hypothetical protein